MQSGKGYKKFILFSRMAATIFVVSLAISLHVTGKSAYIALGAVLTDEDNGIHFENKWVEAGVPLKVIGAPENVEYEWFITEVDGTQNNLSVQGDSYTPTEADAEKLITVKAGNQIANIYFSALPVVYITNATGYYNVGNEYSEASMRIQGNETYSDNSQYYDGKIKIKLRGNSTRMRDKRPFNIKLDSKTNLLDLGENKHYALLANDIDHTLMRNKLLYDFSGAIGMEPYQKSENVVVIFNNEYYGVYQLSELVDLGKNRVDIYDWEDSAEEAAKAIVEKLTDQGELSRDIVDEIEEKLEDAMCRDLGWMTSPNTFSFDTNGDGKEETYTITDYISLPEATGGALLEMDFFSFGGDKVSLMVSAYSQPLYFKSPEYAITNPTFFKYIGQFVQSFEYALHSTDFIYHNNDIKYNAINRQGGNRNPGYEKNDFSAPEYDNKHYTELFDMDSLVQNFIVCEYSMNWDSMKNSVFMYKDIDGLFHMAPEWDFDWAWGNLNMYGINTWYPTSWHTTTDEFTVEQYYQKVQWNRCLIRDPYFLVRAYEKYHEIRGTIIEDMIKEGGTIDTYTEQWKIPAAANDAKWSYSYAQYGSVGFEDSVSNMKQFLATRIKWIDKQFTSIEAFITSLGYYKPDKELNICTIDAESERGYTIITAEVKSSQISSIVFQVNGKNLYKTEVVDGVAVCRVPDSALVSDKDVLNVVQILAVDGKGKYMISSSEKGNYSLAKSNYSVFYTSSQALSKVVVNKDDVTLGILVILVVIILVTAVIIIKIRKNR